MSTVATLKNSLAVAGDFDDEFLPSLRDESRNEESGLTLTTLISSQSEP